MLMSSILSISIFMFFLSLMLCHILKCELKSIFLFSCIVNKAFYLIRHTPSENISRVKGYEPRLTRAIALLKFSCIQKVQQIIRILISSFRAKYIQVFSIFYLLILFLVKFSGYGF